MSNFKTINKIIIALSHHHYKMFVKMQVKPILIRLMYFGLFLSVHFSFAQSPPIKILVFSKTAAFRHESIAAGKTALTKLSKEKTLE